MIELSLRRQGDALIPAWPQDAFGKVKRDLVYRVRLTEQRNPAFHRKFFALLRVAYDVWTEYAESSLCTQYLAVKVTPNFERFRKDLIVAAGCYEPVFALDGQLCLEPKSIQFSAMDETEFEALYSTMIDTILRLVPGWIGKDREALIRAADMAVCEFA